jgi:hypothetical protein
MAVVDLRAIFSYLEQMANIRTISWSAAMRDLRNHRVRRAGVREERLRAAAGLRGLELSSWRGRSGRRYVVGVHSLTETDIVDVTEAIVIAVRRDNEGVAHVVEIETAGPRERLRKSWLSAMRARGATEMHVHRLAETEAARRAIVEDLREDA